MTMTGRREGIGYHGTTLEAAKMIAREGFKISSNEYDWLGDGIYFFQDSQSRAWEWAYQVSSKRNSPPVVIACQIDLTNCWDLLDPAAVRRLGNYYNDVLNFYNRTGAVKPRQSGGYRGMDRIVLNYACNVLNETQPTITVVRGAFEEGVPAFPGSGISDGQHIQLAVRETSAILSTRFFLEEEK